MSLSNNIAHYSLSTGGSTERYGFYGCKVPSLGHTNQALQRVANFGPQSKFPVPPGILNHNGKNTVALALWQLTPAKISPHLKLSLNDAVQGGVGHVVVNNPVWTARSAI